MSDLIIYGASDDLIEVEGVVRDEIYPPYNKPAVVIVRAGDVTWAKIPIEYGNDGIWRMQPTAIYAPVTFIPARGEDEPNDEHGCPGYSDKVVIDMGTIEPSSIRVKVRAS